MGSKSLIGRPKTHCAGDNLVVGSSVLRYCSIARWKELVSSDPPRPVLSVIMPLRVLTPTSARQLLWGNATDEKMKDDDVHPTGEESHELQML